MDVFSSTSPRSVRRRLFSYSLRTLLIGVTALCIFLGLWMNGARRQREAVAALREMHHQVYYDFEVNDYGSACNTQSPLPQWLLNLIGVDAFHHVALVEVVSDEPIGTELALIAQFKRLERIQLTSDEDIANDFIPLAGSANLRYVEIIGIPLNDECLSIIGTWRRLETLTIYCRDKSSDRCITDLGIEHLSELESLRNLRLEQPSNTISDQALVHLARLQMLEHLTLRDTQIIGRNCDCLQKLPHLQWVYLDGSPLTDSGLAHLIAIKKLRGLGLNGTNVTDDGVKLFASLPDLYCVTLSGCNISDTAVQALAACTGLVFLNVSNTHITNDGLLQLKALGNLLHLRISPSDEPSAVYNEEI